MSELSQKVFHIHVFKPKPGRLDDFIAGQLEGIPRLGPTPGLLESRFFRAEDGSSSIVATAFDSEDAFLALQANPALQETRKRLSPLLDGSVPGLFRLVHERKPND